MNIYHIVFTSNSYDEYDSFVVTAKDEQQATELISEETPLGESIESIVCIGISTEVEPRVVLGSFNAG